jgi:hypothetical protein
MLHQPMHSNRLCTYNKLEAAEINKLIEASDGRSKKLLLGHSRPGPIDYLANPPGSGSSGIANKPGLMKKEAFALKKESFLCPNQFFARHVLHRTTILYCSSISTDQQTSPGTVSPSTKGESQARSQRIFLRVPGRC